MVGKKGPFGGFVIMEFLGSGEKIRRQERKSTKRWTPFRKRQQ